MKKNLSSYPDKQACLKAFEYLFLLYCILDMYEQVDSNYQSTKAITSFITTALVTVRFANMTFQISPAPNLDNSILLLTSLYFNFTKINSPFIVNFYIGMLVTLLGLDEKIHHQSNLPKQPFETVTPLIQKAYIMTTIFPVMSALLNNTFWPNVQQLAFQISPIIGLGLFKLKPGNSDLVSFR